MQIKKFLFKEFAAYDRNFYKIQIKVLNFSFKIIARETRVFMWD